MRSPFPFFNCDSRRRSWLPQARPQLERISKSLSERLTYLMEPITPIELDAAECIVQLRSNPPQRDDDGRSYYELIVRRGGEISLVALPQRERRCPPANIGQFDARSAVPPGIRFLRGIGFNHVIVRKQ